MVWSKNFRPSPWILPQNSANWRILEDTIEREREQQGSKAESVNQNGIPNTETVTTLGTTTTIISLYD